MKSLFKKHNSFKILLEGKLQLTWSLLSEHWKGEQNFHGKSSPGPHRLCYQSRGSGKVSSPSGLSGLIWNVRRPTPGCLWNFLGWTLIQCATQLYWGGGRRKPLEGHLLLWKSSWFPLSGRKNQMLPACSVAGKSANESVWIANWGFSWLLRGFGMKPCFPLLQRQGKDFLSGDPDVLICEMQKPTRKARVLKGLHSQPIPCPPEHLNALPSPSIHGKVFFGWELLWLWPRHQSREGAKHACARAPPGARGCRRALQAWRAWRRTRGWLSDDSGVLREDSLFKTSPALLCQVPEKLLVAVVLVWIKGLVSTKISFGDTIY